MAKKAANVDDAEVSDEQETTESPEDLAKAELEAKKKKLAKKKVKSGDMVRVDILGKTIEDNPDDSIVFQASNEEDAKLLISYDPQQKGQFFPELAIIGKDGFLMENLADKIEGMSYFEDKTIQFEPEDAFGKRIGKNIELIKSRRFVQEMKKPPQIGAEYKDKKGRSGRVLKVGSGRVFVDFNHPLAGKKVEYRLRVVDLIDDEDDKIRAFITRRLPGPVASEFEIIHNEETIDIGVPQMVAYQLSQQQGAMFLKMGIARDLQENLDLGTVRFFETYEKYEPPKMPETDEKAEEEKIKESEEDSE